MAPEVNTPLLQKLRASLLQDRKRASLLGALLVVMGILWGRLLLNGPASATASLIRRSVVAMTDAPVPVSHVPPSNPVMDWLAQPRRAIQRNLFAIKFDYYARAGDPNSHAAGGLDSTGASNDHVDQGRQQQILLENLQTQASQLKLQSTMMGSVPRAMVNGELVKEGDTVAGFTVVRIEPRKIVVQEDGAELEVAMP